MNAARGCATGRTCAFYGSLASNGYSTSTSGAVLGEAPAVALLRDAALKGARAALADALARAARPQLSKVIAVASAKAATPPNTSATAVVTLK